MSDVVLRCPHCGTTQAERGECEACHEDTVRYFCPNHPGGRWLDGPVCAECGARAERERAAATSTRRVPPRAAPRTPPRTPPEPSLRRPPRRDEPREAPPAVPRVETPGRFPAGDDFVYPPDIRPEELLRVWRPRGIPFAMGCLKGVLVLGLLAAIIFAIATIWFFGGVINLGAGDVTTPNGWPWDVAPRDLAVWGSVVCSRALLARRHHLASTLRLSFSAVRGARRRTASRRGSSPVSGRSSPRRSPRRPASPPH